MPYVFDMTPVGPLFQFGDMVGFRDRITDLHRRAEITGVFKDGNRLLAPDELPEGVVMRIRHPRLPDGFMTDGGLQVVSNAARQTVEELEPGRHQFFPLALRWRKVEPLEGAWWGMNVTQKRDTVVAEGSKVGRVSYDPRKLQVHSFKQIMLDPTRIDGAHLWREERFLGMALFCSDALHDALKARGLKVFRLHKALAPKA